MPGGPASCHSVPVTGRRKERKGKRGSSYLTHDLNQDLGGIRLRIQERGYGGRGRLEEIAHKEGEKSCPPEMWTFSLVPY